MNYLMKRVLSLKSVGYNRHCEEKVKNTYYIASIGKDAWCDMTLMAKDYFNEAQ